jgi:hypothetical protein
VLINGESEPRKVTFKLPVPVRPEPPPVVGGGVATVRVLGEHVMPFGLPAGTTTAWQDIIRTLMSSNQLSRIQQVSAAGAALSGGGAFATVVDGTSNTDAPQDVETSLLELFEDSPDEWYTIADLTHELQSQGFVVEHEKVRRAVQNLSDQHSELRKVTRKSWSWEPVQAQDDDRDYEPDDHDVEPDGETPEEYTAEKSDAPTISDYVRMEDYVSASDYVDSDGLTTSDIPLEADGD